MEDNKMAACSKCGKRFLVGHNVSHSGRRTKTRYMPNIQKVKTIDEKGTVKRIYICAKCLKAGKIKKAYTSKKPAVTL